MIICKTFISQKCKKYKNTFSIYTNIKIVTVQYLLPQNESISLLKRKLNQCSCCYILWLH